VININGQIPCRTKEEGEVKSSMKTFFLKERIFVWKVKPFLEASLWSSL
jgi:hypothetical protein